MPDTRVHGLGDVRRALVERQIAEAASTFALKSTPPLDAVYNLGFLPPPADHMLKA